MKRILMILVALAATGCATIHTPSGPQRHFFFQRGIILMVQHSCTDRAVVYQAGRGLVAEVKGATPTNIPLEPAVMGDREIQVTVQSLDQDDRVQAIFVESFPIDSYSTTARTWTITASRGFSGGGGGRRSICPS